MLADSNRNASHPWTEPPRQCFPVCYPRTEGEAWHNTEFPLPPAMPGAVALLQLKLASNVADLDAITRLIRTDVGLTAQLLRLAFGQPSRHGSGHLGVGEVVVHLGLEKLRAMAAGTRLLACQPGGNRLFEACKDFWMRARRTAHIAEELAAGTSARMRETAYVAGLLCHIGKLPALLDWKVPGIESVHPAKIGLRMAKAWHFPSILAEIIRRDEPACTSFATRRLLRLINAADQQASPAGSVTSAKVRPQDYI
jgi:HD-like signal output (HDOD) protein